MANLVKAFAGARISNRVVAIFDNDTGGRSAIQSLAQIRLPENIAVIVRTARTGKEHFAHCLQHPELGANMSAYPTTAWIPRPNGAVQPDEWPEPIPLVAETPDPIDSDVLPGVPGAYAEALSKHTETPVDVSILGVLAAILATSS